MQQSELAQNLITWYRANRRILPWREDPAPFHVWLSEIMLQQTRVEAVREYYRRFLEALPDIRSLAEAEEDTVLKLWEGLGYYSRAKNLRKAAQIVVTEFDGKMPENTANLKKLPGIGDYTAAAIASIAFGENAIAVDGNLLRVFARMNAYDGDIKSPAAKKEAEKYFFEILDSGNAAGNSDHRSIADAGRDSHIPGDFNQALMDLGAMVCLPNARPVCEECPWQSACEAHRAGKETEYPKTAPKKQRRIEEKTVLIIRYDDRVVLHRRPAEGLLAGLYEFPCISGSLTREEALQEAQKLGFHALRIKEIGHAKHIFSHIEWHMTGYEIFADELCEPFDVSIPGFLLAGSDEILTRYSIPSAFEKYRKYLLLRQKR